MPTIPVYRCIIQPATAESTVEWLIDAFWETGDDNGDHYLEIEGVRVRCAALQLRRKPVDGLRVLDFVYGIFDDQSASWRYNPEDQSLLSVELITLGTGQTAVKVRVWRDDLPHSGEIITHVQSLLSQEFTIVDEVPESILTNSSEQSHKPDPRLAILSEHQRMIVRLRREGHKGSEISKKIGKSESFVYNHATEIRKILIENYGQEAAAELIPRLR